MESTPHPSGSPSSPQGPITATTVGPPRAPIGPQPIILHQGGGAAGTLFKLLTVFLGISLAIAMVVILAQQAAYHEYFAADEGIQEQYHSLSKSARDKVAIITISGVMMDSTYPKKQIDKVKKDKNVKAVVLRVDTPGGAVSVADYVLHHLKEMKEERDIPVVVSMGGMAASGGYYVSMVVGDDEDTIFAEPTTTTGSIGVIIPYYNISGLLADYNIKDESIVSGPHKQMLSMTRELSPEDRKIVQGYVNEAFNRFKEIVKEGRPKLRNDESALDLVATGEIFSADRALAHLLIDKIGFIEDAIDQAILLANLDDEEVRVVQYKQNLTIFDQLAGAKASANPLSPDALLDLTTPRAYYLLNWMPPVFRNRTQ